MERVWINQIGASGVIHNKLEVFDLRDYMDWDRVGCGWDATGGSSACSGMGSSVWRRVLGWGLAARCRFEQSAHPSGPTHEIGPSKEFPCGGECRTGVTKGRAVDAEVNMRAEVEAHTLLRRAAYLC